MFNYVGQNVVAFGYTSMLKSLNFPLEETKLVSHKNSQENHFHQKSPNLTLLNTLPWEHL